MITTNRELQQLINKIDSQPTLAIDTEFYWRYSYYPQLCLIQIATPDSIYLIDTMAKTLDLSILQPIFSSPSICKIMHAASNDIKILKHYVNAIFNNIFDTQTAMAFLGYPHQMSLQNVLETLDLFDLDKHEKMSDWRLRPLSETQIAYAKADVMYLHPTYNLLKPKLIAIQHDRFFGEEMNEICKNASFTSADKAHLRFHSQLRRLYGKTYSYLKALAIWRERYAQQKNWLVQHILSDGELLKIARLHPDSEKMLADSQILSNKKVQRYSKLILQALNNSEPVDDPKVEPHNNYYLSIDKECTDEAFQLLKKLARQKKIATAIVCSKRDLIKFVQSYLQDPKNLKSKLSSGWRFHLFGQKILDFITTYQLWNTKPIN